VTNLEDAAEHIGEVLRRVKKEHLQRAYKIQDWYVCGEHVCFMLMHIVSFSCWITFVLCFFVSSGS
jgi:hypothetical protein